MFNVFLKKCYILLLFLICFTISKSSHMNSSKKNNNHNLLINKNENKTIQYKSFANSNENDSWFSKMMDEYPHFFFLAIVGIIVVILVIIIIVCLVRLRNRYKDLNTQISKVSFQEDKRDTIDDDDLLE